MPEPQRPSSPAHHVRSFRAPKSLLVVLLLATLIGAVAFPARIQKDAQHESETRYASPSSAVENLRAFAKLYGYVRYFHPSDAANAVDWGRFVIYGASRVQAAQNPGELRQTLDALFAPIAPTVQLYPTVEPPPPPVAELTPADTSGLSLVAWQHRGLGLGHPNPYRSIRLNRKVQTTTRRGFGTISQTVDATPHRGKQVQLRAAVRANVSESGNQAQLWLRVNRSDGSVGFFDNMHDRPITSPDWATYQITGTVAEDAKWVAFGGFLAGTGKAWLDDFQLFVRENDNGSWTRVPITNANFESGDAGRAPSGWGGQSQGYDLATEQVDAYEGAQSVTIEAAETWQMAEPLFEEHPAAGDVVTKRLGRGLSAQIPLALYSRDGQTIRPEAAPSPDAFNAVLDTIQVAELTAANEALRLGDVVIAWNVFQHFYPYFDVVDVDWDAVLTRTLRRAMSDASDDEFLRTLQHMVAQLDDGHGRVIHPVQRETAGLPFRVDWIEKEAVIVAVANSIASGEQACIQRGDAVVAVDGKPAEAWIEEAKPYISGSPQWKTHRALHQFGRGERGTTAQLNVRRDGRVVECQATRNFDDWLQEDRPRPIDEIRDRIYYVDLSRAEMNAITQRIDDLAQADGVVFDLRRYPNGGNQAVLQHLSEDTLRSARWQIPQITHPDRANLAGYYTSRWTLPPRQPQITGTVVFLTDAQAISYAESVMGIVEHYELGEIIGQPTAGANGNVNPFTVPGGYRVLWTGMQVLKHDRSQHHLIGIRPTVPVARTIQAVRDGRDEYLAKALEIIQASNPSGR